MVTMHHNSTFFFGGHNQSFNFKLHLFTPLLFQGPVNHWAHEHDLWAFLMGPSSQKKLKIKKKIKRWSHITMQWSNRVCIQFNKNKNIGMFRTVQSFQGSHMHVGRWHPSMRNLHGNPRRIAVFYQFTKIRKPFCLIDFGISSSFFLFFFWFLFLVWSL